MEQPAFVPSLIWVISFARLCSAYSALQSFRWQHLPAEVVGVPHVILAAISAGACFMGAPTYIGNRPNFMVHSMAEAGHKDARFWQLHAVQWRDLDSGVRGRHLGVFRR
jgi:Na+/H+ antiporter NhaD/arsenite permease-like protein